ncbi:MAG: PadR family transcriptional regulator [Dehalococcoidia bacterium]|nr:PadR family transcriptional regulator [Dehalococcoidia bacterium]MDD5648256.1 PadR family transcriptional regulator [Dehalococcoidia bacterium]
MFRDHRFGRERFFRGFGQESPFNKGDLKYVILDLLKDKPRYGYEVIRALEQRSHGFYTPSPGVVYPTLQMLEEMGYASTEERDGKKIYTITDEGRNFLTEQKEFTDKVKHHMRHHWNPENIAVFTQMMREFGELARVVHYEARHIAPDKLQRIRQVVSLASMEIKAILEE